MNIINLSEHRNESIRLKPSNATKLIKDIKDDKYLNIVFSKISSDNLFNILIPFKTALITYSDKEKIIILKSFWESFEKITSQTKIIVEIFKFDIKYAKRKNNECIILVLCQNTFANCTSLFEPVILL